MVHSEDGIVVAEFGRVLYRHGMARVEAARAEVAVVLMRPIDQKFQEMIAHSKHGPNADPTSPCPECVEDSRQERFRNCKHERTELRGGRKWCLDCNASRAARWIIRQ